MKSLPMLLFLLLGLVWGSNFIYMKWAADYISATQVVLVRVFFGFVPVLLFALYRRELRLEHLRHAHHFFIMSLIATVIYYYSYAMGASLLFSGVAGALSGAIPIFSFLVAMCLLPEEKPTPLRLVGIGLGFLGVLLIADPLAGSLAATNIEGVLYMVAGSLCVGVSFVYARRYVSPLAIPSAALTSYQLGFGLLTLMVLTDYSGLERIATSTHVAIGATVGLGVLGTGLAYVIYYTLIDKLGALTASSVTYLPPVVALVIGAWLVGEPIALHDYLAVLLIFIGVLLVNRNSAHWLATRLRNGADVSAPESKG